MERRGFLKGALALFGAAAVGASMTDAVEAAPLSPAPAAAPVVTSAPQDDKVEGQFGIRRAMRRQRRAERRAIRRERRAVRRERRAMRRQRRMMRRGF